MNIFGLYNLDMDTKKKGRGRPRKGTSETKSESVLLRMGALEKQSFADAAKLAGVPLAVWMRERLRQAAVRELEAGGKRAAFLEHLI